MTLVERLSKNKSKITIRVDGGASALKNRIDMNYIYVLFEKTGTELGIYLDNDKCDFSDVDWEKSTGNAHLEGAITLDYTKVRCLADFSVETMKGKGKLELFENDDEYTAIINASKKNP